MCPKSGTHTGLSNNLTIKTLSSRMGKLPTLPHYSGNYTMIKSPIFIIGCPRSGTTLLFNILSEVPNLWSIGYESKAIIEQYHHPRVKNWESGALDAGDLTPTSRDYIITAFQRQAAPGTFWRRLNLFRSWLRRHPLWKQIRRYGQTEQSGAGVSSALPQQGLNTVRQMVTAYNRLFGVDQSQPIRLLEKTPENCLRLPFLLALFPDARIIYLTRDGRNNINSLMEGWLHPHLFRSYHVPVKLAIPNCTRTHWAFTLIPGWQDLVSSPVEEIAAYQWLRCNEAVLAHQAQTKGQVPYLTVRYENLITQPGNVLAKIADFSQVDFKHLEAHANSLPKINVISGPQQDKWRRQNPQAIGRIFPLIEPLMTQLGYDINA